MANPTTPMKNKNDDRPFGTTPLGTENKPRHDGGNIGDKARDLASAVGEKARETASSVTDKARDLASTAGEKAREGASNVTEKARDLASAVGEKARETAANVSEKARDAACTVGHKASEIASQVGQKAENATAAVGGGMKSLAENIREHSPQGGMLKTASTSVADTLESGARYLEEEGLSGISQDVMNLVRRNPIPAVFVGIALGFLLARATSSRS